METFIRKAGLYMTEYQSNDLYLLQVIGFARRNIIGLEQHYLIGFVQRHIIGSARFKQKEAYE